jgi:hypothetical protein
MSIKLFVCYLHYFINLIYTVYQLLETFVLSAPESVLKKGDLFLNLNRHPFSHYTVQSSIFLQKGENYVT